jgi:hypothetical protein
MTRRDRCICHQDANDVGKVFDANSLTCYDKLLKIGEGIKVAGRAHRYDGADSLGNSIFTATAQVPIHHM